MIRKNFVCLALALAFGIALQGIVTSFGASKGKPAPSPYIAAQVQFTDRTDDHIWSDGHGAYVDGAKGISCYLYTDVNPGTGEIGDLILTWGVSAKRSLNYEYDEPIVCDEQLQGDCSAGPSGAITLNNPYINIRGVNSGHAVGDGWVSSAQMTSLESNLLFVGALATKNPGDYSTPVWIQHPTANTWIVTANPTVADPGGSDPGDIAQLKSSG